MQLVQLFLDEEKLLSLTMFNKDFFRPIAYRPSEAARVLGISLSHLDRLTKAGEIPCARVGRLRLYGDDELRRWIREKTDESSRREQKK